jgi:hypothetical protein
VLAQHGQLHGDAEGQLGPPAALPMLFQSPSGMTSSLPSLVLVSARWGNPRSSGDFKDAEPCRAVPGKLSEWVIILIL